MVHAPARPSSTRPAPALGSVALTLLLVALLGLVAAVTVAPRLVGAVPLAVANDSMQPSMARGDLVVVRPVPAELLEVGDVVAYRPVPGSGEVVTTRVTDVVVRDGAVVHLQTQGDASPYPDGPMDREQLKGRVAYAVPLVGRVAQQPWLLAAVTLGGAVLVGATALVLVGPAAPRPTWTRRLVTADGV
ncbi:signal peptidase I [Xylanimonas protaetiae]|uniref:Signal peptidase I n=1 Tax=Xylanimonas protaetiae TaxID=2509457 RepID=A0A4V0YFW4_9MICO|nr:signal peptidase I [Xylanimonas protaetiae]QAY69121.1 signal peptidase I [Xylanimonas protaetiae]